MPCPQVRLQHSMSNRSSFAPPSRNMFRLAELRDEETLLAKSERSRQLRLAWHPQAYALKGCQQHCSSSGSQLLRLWLRVFIGGATTLTRSACFAATCPAVYVIIKGACILFMRQFCSPLSPDQLSGFLLLGLQLMCAVRIFEVMRHWDLSLSGLLSWGPGPY